MTRPTSTELNNERIVALDYLRVIAVGILFVFHLGMIWVPDWDFHFKQTSDWTWLQYTLMLSSPWRMGLLWFIAGVSLYVMQQKYGWHYLITRRSNAILLPLLFGLWFVVPFQLFVEMSQKGAMTDSLNVFLWHFYFGPNNYFANFGSGVWHHVDVNHLWFLRSLWRFMVLIVVLYPALALIKRHFVTFHHSWIVLFVTLVLLTMNIDDSDTKRDAYGLTCLLIGYLWGTSTSFWQWIARYYRMILTAALLLVFTYQLGYFLQQQQLSLPWLNIPDMTSIAYNASKALSLLAVLTIAKRYFNNPNNVISSFNGYVYPFYVIHQSVLVYVAYEVSKLGVGLFSALMMTFLVSIIFCALVLWLCRSIPLLGLLLGKTNQQQGQFNTSTFQRVIALVTLPLALRLLGII